ncbi:MAG: transporter, partial [Phycisphaerae bacterium]
MPRQKRSAIVCLCLLSSTAAGSDKSAFHLFNPTPRELLREVDTDRPDTTESPHTVDAGHFQIEFSFVDYS